MGKFKKATNNNVLLDEHIEKLMQLFNNKADVPHVTVTIDNAKIAKNNCNISVSSYKELSKNKVASVASTSSATGVPS